MYKTKKKDSSPKVHQKEKLNYSLDIEEFPWTDKQRTLIDVILDKNTKMVFIDGCAGVGKTLLSVYCALKLLNEKKIDEIVYLRTVAESASKSLGFLPGEISDKFGPFMMPLADKLEELLSKNQVDKLIKEEKIRGIPVNFLRGASFNCKCILFEEFQNATMAEAITAISRIGKFSKFICLGDSKQSDIGNKSAFSLLKNLFDDNDSRENGIHCFKFNAEDILRSDILKFIMGRLDTL